MDRQSREGLCFLTRPWQGHGKRSASGLLGAVGILLSPDRLGSSNLSKLPLVPGGGGAGAHLHIPVEAHSRKEQALHVLKCDGTLLFIVDEEC